MGIFSCRTAAQSGASQLFYGTFTVSRMCPCVGAVGCFYANARGVGERESGIKLPAFFSGERTRRCLERHCACRACGLSRRGVTTRQTRAQAAGRGMGDAAFFVEYALVSFLRARSRRYAHDIYLKAPLEPRPRHCPDRIPPHAPFA